MQNDDMNTKSSKGTFGDLTVPTLKGHYTPLSEFEQKAITLITKNFKFFTEASEEEIRSVNRVHLKPSYSQSAELLNEQGFKTKRGNKWSGRTVSRLMKKTGGDKNEKIEQADKWDNSSTTRKQEFSDYAIKFYKEELQTIDLKQKHHIIAQELKDRGVTTRNGSEWGNSAVKRLLIRLNDLGII